MKKKIREMPLPLKVEVDVSGQIGDTKNTVFAFANGESYSILISGITKRNCLKDYREKQRNTKDFTLHFYLAGLSLLFESSSKNISAIYLDREMVGHERKVRHITKHMEFLLGN